MINYKAETFFTDVEKERIRDSVRAVEKGTSGEIATMVVDQSDGYLEAEVLGGILTSGLVALIISIAVEHVTIWTFVPIVCVLYFPVRFLIIRFPCLKI